MSYCVKCGHELIEKENGIDGMVLYCEPPLSSRQGK